MTTLEVMRKALEALKSSTPTRRMGEDYVETGWEEHIAAMLALRTEIERLEAAEPVAWAISYDGKTPSVLWDGGDCALLDLEVKRQGGTTRKMALYTAPTPPAAIPALTAEDMAAAFNQCASLQTALARWAYALAAERAGVTIK